MPITKSRIHPTTFLFGWKFPPEECFSRPFFSDQLNYLNAQLIGYQPSSFQLRKMNENSSSTNDEEQPRSCRCFDISTEEGTNKLLEEVSRFDFFSTYVKEIRKLRKKTRLTVGDEEKLKRLYGFFNCLARNTDPELFRAKIPESEIQDWLDLVIEEIMNFTTKQSWIGTGRLDESDSLVLQSCDYMFKCLHLVPIYFAFKSEFFQVLADFVKARKGHGGRGLPDVTICGPICRIVCSALAAASEHFDNCWSLEKTFKKLEASGILEQFLRCSTVPQPVSSGQEFCWASQDPVMCVLERLVSCPSILTRKFKSGKPCGDTLKAILDGRDGSRDIQSGIWNRLKDIDRLVETLVDTTESINAALPFGTCKCCSKKGNSEAPLKVCSKCRSAHYCSKECQKADWKMHRHSCQKATKTEATLSMVISRFLEKSSESIYQAMGEKCNSTGVEASDLAVEVDFMPDKDGIIPAFHDPPIFRIVLIRDYISGQEVPEWLCGDKVPAGDCRRAKFTDEIKQEMAEGRSTSGAFLFRHACHVYTIRDFFHSDRVSLCRVNCSNRA